MNIDFLRLCKDKRLFRATLGVSQQDYQELIPQFTKSYHQIREENFFSKQRMRSFGGGRKPKVFWKPSKLLFFTLFFLRVYPTYDLASVIFGLGRSQLHFWFNLGLDVLEETVGHHIPLPAPSEKCKDLRGFLEKIPELKEFIIDATEQPTNRPKYNQEFYYSGKKKRHTRKKQVVTTLDGKLISISTTVEGKRHDKKLAEDSLIMTHAPPDATCIADTAYTGLQDFGLGLRLMTPEKRLPDQELNVSQKQFNRVIGSVRVKVENVICHLKYFRIFKDQIRYRKDYDDQISNVVGGLYNFSRGFS